MYDSKTKQPIAANIKYELLSTGKEVGIASSSPDKGEYKIVLPAGAAYGFRAEKDGYFPVSDNIDTKNITTYTEIQRDLYLVPIETGANILINNLFFDFAKATLRPESFPDLNRVNEFIKKSPTIEVEIQGHTDNVGNESNNQKLSENRAAAVKEYLIQHGADASRIKSKGYGKKKPITTNDTDDGRQKNRRVEFVILKK